MNEKRDRRNHKNDMSKGEERTRETSAEKASFDEIRTRNKALTKPPNKHPKNGNMYAEEVKKLSRTK
jgi:hypothetical protein